MSSRLRTSLLRALACTALVLLPMASCSFGPPVAETGAKIWKVKYYHMANVGAPIPAADPSIPFERDYHLYGAITGAQRLFRQGNYYAILWKVTDRTQPVKVRFEYRQQGTGLLVKSKEEDVSKFVHTNVTRFQVIGNDYATFGPVTAWRVTVVRGKEVLAESKSYLWD